MNRILKPNLIFECKVCGAHVEKWVAPSRIRSGQDTGEFCSRTCAGVGRSGNKHFNWKGGRRTDKDGYILIHKPDHPFANADGCVREHRLVIEKNIRRYLKRTEVVHHKNDITSDNRLSNLELCTTNAVHKKRDSKKRKRDFRGRFVQKKKG